VDLLPVLRVSATREIFFFFGSGKGVMVPKRPTLASFIVKQHQKQIREF
jgi:hypothetical protein